MFSNTILKPIRNQPPAQPKHWGKEKTNSATFYTQVTQRMLYEKASLYQQHCTLLQFIPSLAAAGASRKPQNLQARDSSKSRLCTKKERVPQK